MKPYTVLLLRPDYVAGTFGHDTFLAHVEGETPEDALAAARVGACEADGQDTPEDYYCLLCAGGHIVDCQDGAGGVLPAKRLVLYAEYVCSTIFEDSYLEGEARCTGCGLDGEYIGKNFETMQELVNYLHKNYGLSEDPDHYEQEDGPVLFTSKQVADHSNAQNGGWFDPTETEIRDWKQGKLMLYIEHYTIKYHYVAQ